MNTNTQYGIAVTGALGNLGWKLLCHLAQYGETSTLIGLDLQATTPEKLEHLKTISQNNPRLNEIDLIECDLANWDDSRWRDVINRVSTVVHLAAKNPYPDATWRDATVSLDMTHHICQAAKESSTLSRVVFASSNHVMGRYKDKNLLAGELNTELEVGIGTIWHTGHIKIDSTIYATSKFSGERICKVAGKIDDGQTSFVIIRIGWCQPGLNSPSTLSAAGIPTKISDQNDSELAYTTQWFQNMWLSNRDFLHLFDSAIKANSSNWPDACITVNGMSNNTNMVWNLDSARSYLNYMPQDNVRDSPQISDK